MPSQKVRFLWDKDVQGYRIECPYNKAFIEGIKALVPASDRDYDPSTKIWTVAEKWYKPLHIAAERLYPGQVFVFTKEQQERAAAPPAIAKASLDQVLTDFVKLLPNEALIRAYKVAAMELHPDRGGSMEKMSSLNALWQRIKEEKKI